MLGVEEWGLEIGKLGFKFGLMFGLGFKFGLGKLGFMFGLVITGLEILGIFGGG